MMIKNVGARGGKMKTEKNKGSAKQEYTVARIAIRLVEGRGLLDS